MQLSAEQILFFHLNGFLSIPTPVTDDAELAWMREVYDRMFDERAGRDSGDQFDLAGSDEEGKAASLPQILNPAKYAPELTKGSVVYKGQLLGYVGDTGNPGPGNYHLHYEVHPAGGAAVDPLPFLLPVPEACRVYG